jgi:hypothetical protein
LLVLQGGNEQGATLFERAAQMDCEKLSIRHQVATPCRRSNRMAEWREQLAVVEMLNNHAK